jgi:serine/threonine-protein kinase
LGGKDAVTATAELTPAAGDKGSPQGSMLGRQVDHYTLVEELGQGGMSVVYRARDQVLQRDVAIKVLHPFLADRPDARRRLLREARAVAKLRHGNILEVYGFSGEEASLGYIAMELVRGETLKQFGERERIYPCEVAAAVAWVVAGALEHAHESGVIHRDVKPENVMIRHDGVLKLMDFGIAHVVDMAHLTITGTLQGSPAHMAPEVIEGAEVDARADLFSLGTVLFWMATGQLPFTAKTPHALLKKIVDGRYTEPQRLNPEVSDRLAALLRKLMAREPKDRYASATEVKAALQVVCEEGGLQDPQAALPSFFKQPQKCRGEWMEVAAERFVAQAHAHLKAGDRIKALGAVNRVLALKPAHPDAPVLMKRIESRSRTASRLRMGLAVVVTGVLGVAAFTLAELVEEKAVADGHVAAVVDTDPQEEAKAPPQPRRTVPPRARAPVARPSRADPAPADAVPVNPLPGESTSTTPLPDPEPAAVSQVAAVATSSTVPVAPPAAGGRPVVFRVHPWARVEVNGRPLESSGDKVTSATLPVGRHRVRFVNPFAYPEEKDLEVLPGMGEQEVVVHLQVRPARVTVRCQEEATVRVRWEEEESWVSRGRCSFGAVERPITVPMPDRAATRVVVRVEAVGKQPAELTREVRAGEALDVSVSLEDADPPAEREVVQPEEAAPAPPLQPEP